MSHSSMPSMLEPISLQIQNQNQFFLRVDVEVLKQLWDTFGEGQSQVWSIQLKFSRR
jgi:hypothetical protein